MRKNTKFLGVFFAMLGLLIVLLHLLPDEELLPGAAAWLEERPVTVPAENNAYYYIWGLEAPRGVDPMEYGRERVDYVQRYLADEQNAHTSLSEFEVLPDGFDHAAALSTDALPQTCKLLEQRCLEAVSDSDALALGQETNAELLQRYQALIAMPHQQEVEPFVFNAPIPPYYGMKPLQEYYLAVAANRFLHGEVEQALAMLAADLRFSRMLLAEADQLILKLVAAEMVARDLHLYGQLMDSGIAPELLYAAVAAIEPLNKQELSLALPGRAEFRFMSSFISQLSGPLGVEWEATDFGSQSLQGRVWLWLAPMQKFSVSNDIYLNWHSLVSASSLPPSQIPAAVRDILAAREARYGWYYYLYNPIVLVVEDDMFFSTTTHYLLLPHAVNGLLRLLHVRAELLRDGVTAGQVEAYMASLGDAHLYGDTKIQIRWDGKSQSLAYDGTVDGVALKPYLHTLPVRLPAE